MSVVDASTPTLIVRAPTPADVELVAELIIASDIAEFGEPDSSIDDVRREWEDLDLSRDAWLVTLTDGRLVGYGYLWDRGGGRLSSEGYVHPDYEGRGIGTRLRRLIEARAAELAAQVPAGVRVVLRAGTNAHNAAARRFLEEQGYQVVRFFWRMQIELNGPPPAPRWPAGLTVRPMQLGRDEVAVFTALTEAFLDHWGSVPIPFEEWRKKYLDKPDVDTSTWFVVLDGDEPAAAVRCSRFLDMGWVDTLGVRRPWRKQGLGTALLYQVFDAFYQRGIPKIGLGVDAANPTGATRIYERAGMQVTRTFALYEKELRAGEDSHDA